LQDRYTAAVIGGGVGGKLSAAALAASDRFELVALADTRAEARAECAALYPGITTFATHQELFAHHAADVVERVKQPGLPLVGATIRHAVTITAAVTRFLVSCAIDWRLASRPACSVASAMQHTAILSQSGANKGPAL
jgi:UDP-N-acetylmuramoylalanine-D-glutamate ligase